MQTNKKVPHRRLHMKSGKMFAGVAVALLSVGLCTVAVGQDHATPQDVVAKVRKRPAPY